MHKLRRIKIKFRLFASNLFLMAIILNLVKVLKKNSFNLFNVLFYLISILQYKNNIKVSKNFKITQNIKILKLNVPKNFTIIYIIIVCEQT